MDTYGYSVADLARRYKVGKHKILLFVRRGELVGVNVAGAICGRPQWRFTPEQVRMFEERRSSKPMPRALKKRKQEEEYELV